MLVFVLVPPDQSIVVIVGDQLTHVVGGLIGYPVCMATGGCGGRMFCPWVICCCGGII